MKKLVLATFASLSLSAQAAELTQFSDIAEAIKQGKQLTYVFSVKQCDSHTDMPDVTTSVKPNAFMVIGNERVTASDNHFTLSEPMYAGVPVYGFGKFDIFSEGYATIKVTIMQAKDYTKLHEFQIRCDVGHGFNVFDS